MRGDAGLTPLDRIIRARIATEGPISVHDYMGLCLGHSEHGYYRRREAIGRGGDFITAPEISQVFGELIGLWSATVGEVIAPDTPLRLIEIGPGRGTLMADAMRVLKVAPRLVSRMSVHLIEPSPALTALQQQTLEGRLPRPTWHEDLGEVPSGPAVIIANEVVDAMPVRQLVRRDDGWHERMVAAGSDGALAFTLDREPATDFAAAAPCESLIELRPDAERLIGAIAERCRTDPTIALLIDYGHERTGFGDTLQAVSRHQRSDPLARAGETDLSAQVDFEALAATARDHGLDCDGPEPQAAFLGALGVVERTERLMRAATPAKATAIEAGVVRLIDPHGMGSRFKVLALKSPGIGRLPGF